MRLATMLRGCAGAAALMLAAVPAPAQDTPAAGEVPTMTNAKGETMTRGEFVRRLMNSSETVYGPDGQVIDPDDVTVDPDGTVRGRDGKPLNDISKYDAQGRPLSGEGQPAGGAPPAAGAPREEEEQPPPPPTGNGIPLILGGKGRNGVATVSEIPVLK